VTRSAIKLLNTQQPVACEEGKKRKTEDTGIKNKEKRRKSEEEENDEHEEEVLVRRKADKSKAVEEVKKADKEKPKGRTRVRKVQPSSLSPLFYLL
jgi:hypothetical protein